MISVTQRAASVLAEALRAGEAGQEVGFRLVPARPGEILLAIDGPREGDRVVRHEERTVLLLDEWAVRELAGAVLDAEISGDGASLTLTGGRRPSARWN
ncbi:MAG TPA: hypothetical protein VNN10_10355 [Dehalococcoidia bacterium]|nr:hypothetical protein [Dehalococcoidia bacterium]